MTGLAYQVLWKETLMDVFWVFFSDGVNPYNSMYVIYSMWLVNYVVAFKLSHKFEEICRWNFIGWYSAREWKERGKQSNTTPDILVDELLVPSERHIFHPA